MPITSIDLNPDLVARAKELTGSTSAKAVVDLALRRLIASKQKHNMLEGILTLTDLPANLGAPTVEPQVSGSE